MCTICFATRTFDPLRHDGGPVSAELMEGTDAAAGIATSYSMQPEDTFQGVIDTPGDRDWVAITLEAGVEYTIDQLGSTTGGGTLSDTYLRLYDSSGALVSEDDDSGAEFEAQLVHLAETTGTYYISAGAWGDSLTGSYTIAIESFTPPPPPDPGEEGTLDQLAYQLTHGYWGDYTITWDVTFSNVVTVNLDGLTADGRQFARWAMEAWEMVVDLDFQEVAAGDEMITMDDEDSGAWAYAPGGSDADGIELNVSRNWISGEDTIDTYSFQTFMHEIGHAIGLGHQGDYDGNATWGVSNLFANDSWQMSVMSYFDQEENDYTTASFARLSTVSIADILASQTLYGASTLTAGDTVWGKGSNIGNYLDGYFANWAAGTTDPALYNGGTMALTIYDQGGIDLLDLGFLTTHNRVDMRAEAFSDIDGKIGTLAIARGTVLENAVLGSGDDTVTGNAAANEIDAGAGDDVLSGLGGDDVLIGNLGADLLSGGDNNDRLFGGNHDDTLEGGTGDDILRGGGGRDFADGGADDDHIFGGSSHDTLRGSDGDDTLLGEDGNDFLRGDFGADLIDLGAGNDRFVDVSEGLTGADTITGGAGADTFIFRGTLSHEVITDFERGVDVLRITEASVSGRSAVQVVRDLVVRTDDGFALQIDDDQSILFQGMDVRAGLASDIEII